MGSTLALTEKKLAKSRSIGSVFFHFFDWNRMLSKKKKKKMVFSNNKLLLLPSVSKKFDGEEKMPKSKHFLITDDNDKDCPIPRKQIDLNNQMRDPGPIVKLMGLESMPIVHPKKPSKPSLASELPSNRYGTSEVKESRPLKLQKTGEFLERRQEKPVDSSSEALHLNKRVRRLLSKQHHKLASPLKSPRLLSKQHHKLVSPLKSPRLLSKQSTSRLTEAATKILEPGLHQRKSIKYVLISTDSLCSDEEVSNGIFMEKYNISSDDSVMGKSGSFDSLNKRMEFSLNEEDNMKVKSLKHRTPSIFSRDKIVVKRSLVTPSGKDKPTVLDVPKMNADSRFHGLYEKKNRVHDDRDRKNSIHNQLPTITLKLDANSKMDNNSKRCSHSTLPAKESGRERVEITRSGMEWKNKALKRRTNNDLQSENAKVSSFTFEKQQGVNGDSTIGKGEAVVCKHSLNCSPVKRELKTHVKANCGSECEGNEIVSFTFSSPMPYANRSFSNFAMVDKRRRIGRPGCNTSRPKKLISDQKIHCLASQRVANIRGDTLSAFLEEHVEEFLDTSCSVSTNIPDLSVSHGDMVKTNGKFQIEAEACISSAVSNNDHPSPMSILEASFSVDSCFSGSPNDTSVHNPDNTCNNIRSSDLDADLLDSASSFDIERLDVESLANSLGKNSVVENINLYEAWFSGCKLSTEAILNAKLFVEHVSSSQSIEKEPIVFDTLESITKALVVADTTDGNRPSRLLFDRVIECLDSLCNGLFNIRPMISSLTRRERLKQVICEEIEGWNDAVGKGMDAIVEKDVRHLHGTWTKFKIEAFEACVQIENGLLNELVGEIVMDLCS